MFDDNHETEMFLIIHYLLKLTIDRNVHILLLSISKIYSFEIKFKSVTVHNFDKFHSWLI